MSTNTLTLPTCNETDSIGGVLDSRVAQTRLPDDIQVDNWAEQAKAERGSGNANLVPLLVGLAAAAAMVFIWMQLPIMSQSTIPRIGWPILGVTTVLQTLTIFFILIKRHRGYRG
ncbi:hypothetical protein E3O42_03270 [Cryobacterium adonitolivorans]|uniref:Uncharacterized protein n=1 Tax=Cryobacterium adonitolivorans TaxID=1259189 RepID=A0A4R8WFI7_9MICO|nr:hypothetical protein [Cryobacterium adonitolivorans]TFC05583.1 hypothetical protein E3O42_03270 [Cryobacterium adonitolivorans]